jgi:hypothetical protein
LEIGGTTKLSLALIALSGFAILLLILVGWVLLAPRRDADPGADICLAEESDRRHVVYFPQVRQAMGAEDIAYLASKGSRALSRRVRNERRKIARAYLACLRGEFLKLWRLARVIASLSPRVGAAQEFARLRLGLFFSVRYEVIRFKLLFGFAPLPELSALSEVVGTLAMRLETAMREMGERAAMASKLTSPLEGRGLRTR